ncbi:MAG: L,D-transpeptidase family protein [Hyphomicrobiales bacterium]
MKATASATSSPTWSAGAGCPRDLGRRYIMVNVPDFMLKFVADNAVVHTTRVIVGQTDKQTPIFSDEMEHIVVNPYWNVPSSIAAKEMLPKIQNDPEYFQRHNYEIVQQVGRKVQVVDPASIDWSSANAKNLPFRFRQPPGARNALGNIKFMFPNQHSVYLHDTSSRGLFKRDYRALSHGCVRVDDPMSFADVVLAEEPDWNAARLKKSIGGGERTIKLDHHIPVHITYFTTYVNEAGDLVIKNDLYGHNARVKKALGLKS